MALLEPLLDRLNRFVRAMNYNREDAKDIISETLLRAWESFDKVRSREAFLSYLFTIAYRTNIKYRKRNRFFSFTDDDNVGQIAVSFDPDKNLEVEQLYKALDKLPSKQKQAVILYEISGFSIDEVAAIQETGSSTVKSRLKRGREKLTEIMTKDERFVSQGYSSKRNRVLSHINYNIINDEEVINYQVIK